MKKAIIFNEIPKEIMLPVMISGYTQTPYGTEANFDKEDFESFLSINDLTIVFKNPKSVIGTMEVAVSEDGYNYAQFWDSEEEFNKFMKDNGHN